MDSDKLKKHMKCMFSMQSHIVDRLSSALNYEAVERLIEKIKSCNKAGGTVLFMGKGVSGSVCNSAAFMLRRAGICSIHVPMSDDVMSQAGSVRRDDLAIVVSKRGINSDVYQMAKMAKERGAYIFTVTNYPASPLAVWADDMLLVPLEREVMDEEYLGASSGVAMMSLFNSVASVIREENN